MILDYVNPTKMCIKSEPYLHKKSANRALDMILYFDAAALMLLITKSVPNSTIRNFNLNFDAELAPNLMQISTK